MNSKRIRQIGLVLFVLGLLSCGEKKPVPVPADNSDGWKTVTTDAYTIRYPSTWTLDNSGRMGMTLQIFSALSSPDDKFRENVNLVIQDLSGQPVKKLDQYMLLSENQIKTMLADPEILSCERSNRDGQEFQNIQYTAKQGIYKLRFQQYCTIKNEKAYVLTFTCVADEFEKYREVGGKIMDSFKLNN
jgi:hypothetical protein